MKTRSTASVPVPLRKPPGAARRILVVDDDPGTLYLVTELLRSDPVLFDPVGVESAEEALRVLGAEEAFDCLLVDVNLPGMDGLQLLLAARKLRAGLKIVVMTTAPSEDLRRAVLEIGAVRLLAKPLDFEELLASLAVDRPGSLSHLAGDLDPVDVCRLAIACRADGGVRLGDGEREALLLHRSGVLVHAEADGLEGPAALTSLRSWGSWRFESLPATHAARPREDPGLVLPSGEPRAPGGRAEGTLRGLTLRHLIEWAMRGRETCTLTVACQHRTGVLSFVGGKVSAAETAEREGGRAAAEILGWEGVRVEVIRSPAVSGGGLAALLDHFCGEIEGAIASAVVRRADGAPLAVRAFDPRLDAAAMASGYLGVVDGHLAAAGAAKADWGETEDLLITTARAYVLIRLLGRGHYHWLAVSTEGVLASCRLLMRRYEPLLLGALDGSGS